jgi:Tfp pilus assembly protein PilF
MRGPWTSGGIEANYGIIGHTPNCATPVDFTTIKRDDGSVSCVVGVLDLLTRTSWSLDINLPKDKAYFTTNSFWYNATSYEQPYYSWMNTGIKAAGNLQFTYSGKNFIGHEGEYGDWPVNKLNGKDISYYNNNNFGGYKSYHVFGKYTDFFGGYWHDDNFGMGRYSSHDDKAGKKIWIWGLSQQGMIWEKLLTDTDGQYVEVQSGRLFNQSAEQSMYTPFKYRSFEPHQTDVWTEYWFPVKHTKGFVKANDFGAINIKKERDWLKIYFSPLQMINDKIELTNNGKTIYSKKVSLKPMQTFVDSVSFSGDENNLQFSLGENKLVWSSSPKDGDLNRPTELPKDFDHNSVYGLYLQGKNLISFRDYLNAEGKLNECLKKDPYYAPALVDKAFLELRRFKHKDALETATKALSIDTYDAGANYYYALASLHFGNNDDAKDGFDIASQSPEYRSASLVELSKMYLRENDFMKTKEYAEKSLVTNQKNIDAQKILIAVSRLQNETGRTEKLINDLKGIDPLNHFANFEKYLLDRSQTSKYQFVSSIENEMPTQTFLELAIWYNQIGRKDEAVQVLSLAPTAVEIRYWKSFLKSERVDLNNQQPGIDFPFRDETAEVLTALIKSNDHWLLKYHLGLIEWNRNNITEAKELFSQCGTSSTDASFYAAKAALVKDNADTAETNLKQAIALDQNEWRYNKLLTEHFINQNQFEKALNTVEPFFKSHPGSYIMGMLYAKTLLLNQQFAKCDALLSSLKILPFEGATIGRQLFQETKLMQAVTEIKLKHYKAALRFINDAKSWPANLGVGKPYQEDIDERLENWLSYLCYSNLGNQTRANQSIQQILKFTPQIDNTLSNFLPANHLVSAWAIEKTSSSKSADDWLQQQANLFPANKRIRWSLQAFRKEPTNLTSEEKDGTIRILEQVINFPVKRK